MKKPDYTLMTNRDLYTAWQKATEANVYEITAEMAKRLNMLQEYSWSPTSKMREHVAAEFRHWKLNGPGNEYH